VALLRGRSSLDGRQASAAADSAWWAFTDRWAAFLVEHPRWQREMDPYWVILDVLGTPVPITCVPAMAAYLPPAGAPMTTLTPGLNGNAFFRAFATVTEARHFMGWMQGRCPGLRMWLMGNVNAPVYY
jgi:hypothetical protein